jgi:hypothetical protein
MESLERLASSIAQVDLLVASLKRENRDLAGRLAASAAERLEVRAEAEVRIDALNLELREIHADAEARIEALNLELRSAREAVRLDPELEARVQEAERESLEMAQRFVEAHTTHLEEKTRLEALIRRLEAQVMADQGQEELPVASAETLSAAQERERRALAAQAEAQERTNALGAQLKDLQAQLAGAAKLDVERTELKRQRREVAAFAKERNALRRKVEELLATLESVRLG